ncbi:MAG: polyphosphate kinase 1 [Candidatus Krumholzibacteriia bacterium]
MVGDPAPERLPANDRTAAPPVDKQSRRSVRPHTLTDREQLYINRELSLLEFQRRVLQEATCAENPLLERVKFLAITGANLDEFFMVRVGGLIMQQRAGIVDFSLDGHTPAEQLAAIRKTAVPLMQESVAHWQNVLRPELARRGIHVLEYPDLNTKQRKQVESYFYQSIFPVLTPQALDPGHPFPHISNLSLNLAILIRDPRGEEHFARVKVPAILPRLVPLKRSSGGTRKDGTVPHHHYFVWMEQVVAAHLDALFPGMEILEAHAFRVTRNADIEIQELEASDLLETMTESVQERRFGPVVRLELSEEMTVKGRDVLVENLAVNRNDVYSFPSPLGLGGLMALYEIDRYDLKDTPFSPTVPKALRPEHREGSIFAAIRQGDILLHHPYEAFDPVTDFLKAAARDPDVLAIKHTLYRVGARSPVVKLLLEARREHRKQVTVLVELKARFDEESNIGWAKMLESEGVHVIYGMLGLKTHAKVLLVVRREGDDVRRYLHLGTGNYNHVTARLYEDVGVLTCDPDLGADATDLFNYLTGYSSIRDFRKLLVAPLNLRRRLEDLIRREITHRAKGREARLILKCNSVVDEGLISLLYGASQAGVPVDLIVRGMCSLRPGVPGLSENIRVRSIVGRFLEHSRIYCFANGGQEEIYLGSADLMTRNLDRRVESVFPVLAPALVRRLRDTVLAGYLADNVKARIMKPDGSYERVTRETGEPAIDVQELLLRDSHHS